MSSVLESAFALPTVSQEFCETNRLSQAFFSANLSCYERRKTRTVIDWGIEAFP